MFPTQKLYQTVDRQLYFTIKQEHVDQALYSDITAEDRNSRSKWNALQNALIPLFRPAEHHEITTFFEDRATTRQSDTLLSLETCLDYCEQFYFLLTTADPAFQLNDSEKTHLKQLLLNAMTEGCEPGKQERLELALTLHRRDTNWIDGRLSQARYHVLEALAEQCNQALAISGAYRIHTIKYMKHLIKANQLELGIDPEAALTDRYLHENKKNEISNYFVTNYRPAFLEYEQQVVNNLAQQLLTEWTDFLRQQQISVVNWEQKGLLIPLERYQDVFRFFEDKSFEGVLPNLVLDETNYEQLIFKSKPNFIAGLRTLVAKKLLTSGYYASVETIQADQFPTWHPAETKNSAMMVTQAVQSMSLADFPRLLTEHRAVFIQYPHVMQFAIEKTIPDLSATIRDQYQTQLTTMLRATNVNVDEIVIIHETIRNKQDTLHSLCEQSSISALTLFFLAQEINPNWILGAYEHRLQAGLSPLPYCDYLSEFLRNSTPQALSQMDNWYATLIRHHPDHRFIMDSPLQCLQRTIRAIEALAVLIKDAMLLALSGLTTACLVGVSILLQITFACVIPLFILMTTAIILCLATIALFGPPSEVGVFILAFVTDVIAFAFVPLYASFVSVPMIAILANFNRFIISEFEQFFTGFSENDAISHVHTLSMTFYATTLSYFTVQPMNTLEERCEQSITRLLFMCEDPTANQKGALLAQLWETIKQEGPWDSEDDLKTRLNRVYTVHDAQGQSHSVSFMAIAATKRSSIASFDLNDVDRNHALPTSKCGFFSFMPTKTESMLQVPLSHSI